MRGNGGTVTPRQVTDYPPLTFRSEQTVIGVLPSPLVRRSLEGCDWKSGRGKAAGPASHQGTKMPDVSSPAKCGVLYVATGTSFTKAAVASAKSVRQHSPGVEVDIFTDEPSAVDPAQFDHVHVIPDPHRRSKVDYLDKTRFDRTLYLDTDTRVLVDVRPVFEILDRFDVAAAHGHLRNRGKDITVWREKIPPSFPQVNSGVFLYKRSEAVWKFLENWRVAFHSAGFSKDQVTLRELLWLSDLRVLILPPEYNVRYRKYLDVWGAEEASAKILHYKRFHDEVGAVDSGGRWRGARSLYKRLRSSVTSKRISE